MDKKRLGRYLTCIALWMLSQFALAAGFQSHEQSAARLGAANAGTAVMPDASIAFFNPAGMVLFQHAILGASGVWVDPDFRYSVLTATDATGFDITGSRKQPGEGELLPSFYYIQPINDTWFIGLSLTVPFGLSTDYGEDSLARYFATKSKTEVININPSVAVKLTNKLSVGVGLDVQYFEAELNQAVDFASLSTFDNNGDVFIRNKADDWSLGWNMGVLYQISPQTRVGLAYRSIINHFLDGHMTVSNVPDSFLAQFFALDFGLRDSLVHTHMQLPDMVTFSLSHQIIPKWTVMADVQYVFWSRLKHATLSFKGIPTADTPNPTTLEPVVLDFDYKNSWRVALGQEYQVNDYFLFRAGVAYDQTPARGNAQLVRLPDSNRYWLTLGVGLSWCDHWKLDLSYAHIFFENHRLMQSNTTAIGTTTFVAHYTSPRANLLGAQLSYQFA